MNTSGVHGVEREVVGEVEEREDDNIPVVLFC